MSSDGGGWTFDVQYKGNNYVRGFYADGSGNESTIIITGKCGDEEREILVFNYENESSLNTYGATPPVEQIVFQGVPTVFQDIIQRGDLTWAWR